MVVPLSRAGHQRVTHPFATLVLNEFKTAVRLACIKHTASVHPEPGSNSPLDFFPVIFRVSLSDTRLSCVEIAGSFCRYYHSLVVKVLLVALLLPHLRD